MQRPEARLGPRTYERTPRRIRRGDLTIAVIATVYSVFLVYAAGLPLVLLSMIFYAPATVLFVIARREQGQRIFRGAELFLFLIALAGAVAAVLALTRGWVVPGTGVEGKSRPPACAQRSAGSYRIRSSTHVLAG